jgi:type I restriction modification DNA specificity domain protein
MAKFKRYDSYKNSGVEWLVEIPSHWEILANKYIFKLKRNLVGKRSNKYALLSLTLDGIVKRDLDKGGKFPAEFDTYQEVKNGDFVFCLFDVEETPRTIGLSEYDGMITGAYTVFDVRNISKKYLYYFYLNLDNNKRLKPLYLGLRNTISKENFFSFKTFIPPKDEQEKIASYLDEKIAKIDASISGKEKFIELLKEQKQIIINDAVTKGLNKNAKFKNSGVEWLGEIPSHWKFVKLGQILKPVSIKKRVDLPLLSITREKGVILRDIENKDVNHNFIPDDLNSYKVVKKGQFVINKMKAWQGSYGVSEYTGIVSPAYFIFEFDGVEKVFFHRAIRSSAYIPFFIKASDGLRIGQWDLSKSRMKEILFFIPPKSEQKKIVEYTENKISKIDKLLNLEQEYIKSLKEYKASLIDSVATGKVKV